MPATQTVSAATRSTYPELASLVEFVAGFRAQPKFYARRIAQLPTTLAAYIDYAFGTAPKASDKKKGRAAALRELAVLTTEAAAELEAAYQG